MRCNNFEFLPRFFVFLFFFSPISAHFVKFIVFYKTGPCRLKASHESPRRPEHQGKRISFKAGDRCLHSISKMWMMPFQVLCGTPAFSFGAHYSIFFFFLCLHWFECSQKQGGSPHKVIYLFSPHFFLCIFCQALPVSLGFLSQGRRLSCMSLCVSSSLPCAPFCRSCPFLSLLSHKSECTVFKCASTSRHYFTKVKKTLSFKTTPLTVALNYTVVKFPLFG